MKNPLPLGGAMLLGYFCLSSSLARAAEAAAPNQAPAAAPEHYVVAREAHSRVWQRDNFITLLDGRVVNRPSRFTELATGLYFFDGEWKGSREEIQITATGAAATKGQHQVDFAGNLNTVGAITVTMPDGRTLRSRVLGLAFTDAAQGRSAWIAQVHDASGLLYAPNQVVYPNAFSGVLADIRLAYTKSGLESDVILREQLPQPANFNFDPDSVLVEVWHEFTEAPEPVQTSRSLGGLADVSLNFGAMRMGRGSAFALGGAANRLSGAPVGKTWLKDGNRSFLIESVRYKTIRLENLPAPQAALQRQNAGQASLSPPRGEGLRVRGEEAESATMPAKSRDVSTPHPGPLPVEGRGRATSRLALLHQVQAPPAAPAHPVKLALNPQAFPAAKGLVIDYVLLTTQTNPLTLAADSTYLISGPVTVNDLKIEGGTVVKYVGMGANPYLEILGVIDCATAAYRPAIFTAKDDNTVGETISGSTGTPSGSYALWAIMPQTGGNYIHDVRVSYAEWGLVIGSDTQVRHAQFTFCQQAIQPSLLTLTLDNTLFYRCGVALSGCYGVVVDARHITAHVCSNLVYAPDNDFALHLTNSLLVNVTNWGTTLYYTNAVVMTTNEGAFQIVGSGAHYLSTTNYRNVGTANIPSALLADLRQRTTFPPVVLTNVTITANTNLLITAQRGTNAPDLGYHYAALDYAIKQLSITNATVTIGAGVAMAGYATNATYDFLAICAGGGSIVCEGGPTRLNRLVAHTVVQEQANSNWQEVQYLLLTPYWTATIPPGPLRCRFTEFSAPAARVSYLTTYDYSGTTPNVSLVDCQFHGGQLIGGSSSVSGSRFALTNNLLDRTYCSLWLDWGFLYNNTFHNHAFDFAFLSGGSISDNLFDGIATTQFFDVTNGYNGYTTNSERLFPTNTHNVLTNSVAYESGPLGGYYLPTNSPFLNLGSRNANNAGLYWYTTATSQKAETNSPVDIGFHYLALDSTNSNAQPLDTDGDGVPNYVEDANGNGVQDVGETSVTRQDSPFLPRYEPLGPSSRRTPLIISEIMYAPATGNDYIELYNTHHLPQRLDGFGLFNPKGGTNYVAFGQNSIIAANSFTNISLASGTLKDPGQIQLRNGQGAVLLEVKYSSKAPWPKEAGGAGHSLVLARPSYGENDPRAWALSARMDGSPGLAETNQVDFLRAIKINEFLANPTNGQAQYIELYNASTMAVDVSGCFLSSRKSHLTDFKIPSVTIIPGRGFAYFTQGNGPGQFTNALSTNDSIYFTNPDQTRVIDSINFDTQDAGVAMGRSPDGAPTFSELATRSPGGTNDSPFSRNIVITEIMYHPLSGDSDQFVEIYNRGTTNQNLNKWKFDGDLGSKFGNITLAPSNFFVIAFDAASLAAKYPNLTNGVNLFQYLQNNLKHSGQRVALVNREGMVMNEVTYSDGGRWGQWSDGGGSSLELTDPRSDSRRAGNWADSLPSSAASWTNLSVTGFVQNGDPYTTKSLPAALELMMLGAGECLVDDVEVIATGGTNLVGNGTFDGACLTVITNETASCGTNAGACWFAQGTHEFSQILTNGGTTNGPCLWVRATERGDYLANRIVTCWSSAISTGATCIIRAKVKWLRGHPELVFRLRGSYLEAVAHMTTTPGGTPGLANSQAVTNAPPAIWDVQHLPVVPAANELVTIYARAHDPDGVTNLIVKYRVDPSASYTNLMLRDDGLNGDALAGDGLFSATLPAQASGTVVAFIVEATDAFGATNRFPKAQRLYPSDTFQREGVIRYGDGQPTGDFGVYRVWLTTANYNQWSSRNRVHNSPLDTTFVYGSARAIYNAGAKYAGSVYTSTYGGGYNTPTGNLCGYSLDFPSDDQFLGASGAGLDYDNSSPRYLVSENMAMSLADRLGLENNYRRFIHLYVHGTKRTSTVIYEDAQQPNSDYLAQWYPGPGQDAGQLFKLEVWWGVPDAPLVDTSARSASLDRVSRTWPDGSTNLDVANYRFSWLPRAVNGTADDYHAFSNLVSAVENPSAADYHSNVTSQIDDEQWMRTLMFERVVNNTDSYGFSGAHNMYAYHALPDLKWKLLMIDLDGIFQYSGTNYTPDPFRNPCCADGPIYNGLMQHPSFRRAMWRCMYDMANPTDGVLLTNTVWPLFYGSVAALSANGYSVPSTTDTNSDQNFIATQQGYLWGRLAEVRPQFAILSPTNGATITSATVTLAGVAPVEVRGIKLNGTIADVTWTTVTNWSLTAPLSTGSNYLQAIGYDRKTNALPVRDIGGYTNAVVVYH